MKRTSRPRRSKPTPPPGTPPASAPPFVPPYPPSWVDRLTTAIDRLPGPAWLSYLLLAIAGIALQLAIQQSTGVYHPGPAIRFHLWTAGYFAYVLAMIYYLDRSAGAAIRTFRPLLQPAADGADPGVAGDAYADLRYRLTTLPPRPTLWASIAGAVVLALVPLLLIQNPADRSHSLVPFMVSFGFSPSPAAVAAALLHYFLSQALLGALIYHTVHQLRLINHIYAHHTRLNLYRLQPLYAFSIPAALTAGGLLLFNYAWFATAPLLLNQPVSRALAVLFSVIAFATFLWPLWGMHRRLVNEKKRLLQESSSRFEAAVSQLHRRVDGERLTRMDDLNKTLASLEIEQAALHRVPTWPWEPGTLRGLVAALLVPILIWVTQTLLQRFLG